MYIGIEVVIKMDVVQVVLRLKDTQVTIRQRQTLCKTKGNHNQGGKLQKQ
jgi:hypothetical protein